MESTSCLLCGSAEGHVIFRNSRDKYFQKFEHLKGKESILVMCARCGFAYHNPKLSREETERIYKVLYRPEVPSARFLEEKRKAMLSHLQFIEAHLDLSRAGTRILDVGCSEGTFLSLFRERTGWEVYGVEPSETFGRYAREVLKLPVAQGFFSDDVFQGLKFDVVTCLAVLEHLHDPMEVLMAVRERMTEDGYLFVLLPNVLKPRGNLRFTLLDSTHLFIFTPNTARRLLAKAGFRVIGMDASRPAHLRAIARRCPLPELESEGNGRMDDHREVRRILRRHQIRWYLTAEWKEQIQRTLLALFGESTGERLVGLLKRCYSALR